MRAATVYRYLVIPMLPSVPPAAGEGNSLYAVAAALECGAALGEVPRALVGVFGRYRPRT
jgi:hypothetical protein